MNTLEVIEEIAATRLDLPLAELNRTATFRAAGIDSLAAIDLIVAVEKRFDVTINERELEAAQSLTLLAEIVDRLVNENSRDGGA